MRTLSSRRLASGAGVLSALALVFAGLTPVSAQPVVDGEDGASLERSSSAGAAVVASSGTHWEGVESETGLWIVRFAEPSVAAFTASLSSEAAAADVESYRAQLNRNLETHRAEIDRTLGRSVEVAFTYDNVLNGLAVEVSADEAATLRLMSGVADVYPDTIRELDTDVSHEIILSDAIWDGETATDVGTKGEGIIVAMIDSGVNPGHPSFAETDMDGYTHVNPHDTYLGVCAPGAPGFMDICNEKLIGAYNFHPASPGPLDEDGHGSHTGSTIAGTKHLAQADIGGTVHERVVQGVAPHANIISYKVCHPSCPSSATVAAVNAAIADDVTVLNYSISGSDFPWADPVDLAFLDAYAAGISVVASAGNDGPGASTAAKSGPWNSSVAATTHHRAFGHEIAVTAPTPVPEPVQSMPGFPGDGPAITTDLAAPMVDAGAVAPGNHRACTALPAGSMTGAIGVIERGDCTFQLKVENAQAAGAVAVVIGNNVGGPPVAPGGLETTTIPAVQTDNVSYQALVDTIADNGATPTEGVIRAGTEMYLNDDWTDIVAGFSSRGPSQYDMLLPTFAAPGVNILAAGAEVDGDPNQYLVLQGTSMSSPHGAGAAALLRALNPEWTPSEVRSALAATGDTDLTKENATTPADPFDIGSGRINLANASTVGLVLDETHANFVAANPGVGGDPATLNLPAVLNRDCAGTCSWERTVTSTVAGDATFTASSEAPAGTTVTVEPASFTLAQGESQTLTITVDTGTAELDTWLFGRVALSSDATHASGLPVADTDFPIAIQAEEGVPELDLDPTSLESTQGPDTQVTQTLTIGNTGGADLEWEFGTGDAGGEVTLTHSTSNEVVTANSVACSPDEGFSTVDNGYLRHFALSDLGVTGDLSVTSVSFGVEAMRPTAETVGVNLYRMIDPAGAFVYSNFEALGSTSYTVEPMEAQVVTVPVTAEVPAGSTLVVEVDAPDLGGSAAFFIGSNAAGQSAPSYLRSATCGLDEPTDTAAIGFPGMHIVMSVTGEAEASGATCAAPGDPAWLSVDPLSGTVGAGDEQAVEVTFDSTGLADGTYTAELCLETNDPAQPTVTVPVTLEVGSFPGIEVNPGSLESSQLVDTTTEHVVSITNTGDADLVWDIGEAEAGEAAVAPQGTPYLPQGADRGSEQPAASGPAPATVLPTNHPLAVDSLTEVFDDVTTLPADGWAMTNNSEPVGTSGWFQGNVTVFPAHEGAPTAYVGANFNNAGDSPGHISNWLMTPELSLTNDSTLSFWTRSPAGSIWADRLEVRMSTAGASTDVGSGYAGTGDFTERLLVINESLADSGYPQEWTQFEVTIDGLDAPTTGRLAFRYHVPDGGPFGVNSNYIGIDTVSYEAGEVVPHICELGTDIPWLSAAPDAGTLAPGASADVTVSLDSTGYAVGDTEHANLCVNSNDPANPRVLVPVTMNVIDQDPVVVDRLAGDDRYSTAAAVSGTFAPGGPVAFVATGQNYPDALTGSALAGSLEAPVVLTKTDHLPAVTAAELQRLEPQRVVVLGGPTVVSDAIVDQIAGLTGVAVERLQGDDRYATAAAVSGEFAASDLVYIATGANYPDALAASAKAGSQDAPVLLVRPDHLPAATIGELDRLAPDSIILMGGEGAVQDEVYLALRDRYGADTVDRIAGENRYETAALLTETYPSSETTYVASGMDWPDALTGAARAGADHEPLVLTRMQAVPNVIWSQLLRLNPDTIVILGGLDAVSQDVEDALRALR
ncbi:MAG: S8 family serine peptidase [Actinomycetales bacterium]|nr:S8 family serine peptidase [Actinomycetales bacterium]